MERTTHRRLVYNSMKFYYFYNRPDYQLAWNFIHHPTEVLDTIPVRIDTLDNLLLSMQEWMKQYFDQFANLERYVPDDRFNIYDLYPVDNEMLKVALAYNQKIILGTMNQGIVLREDYFKLAVSHLFYLLELMKSEGMNCKLLKEIRELLPKEPVPLFF